MRNLSKPCITAAAILAIGIAMPMPMHAIKLFGGKKKAELPARKLTPAQNALIDKAVAREAVVIKTLKDRTPLVETYIQNMKPDVALLQVPVSDEHFLNRVDFSRVIGGEGYTTKPVKQTGKDGKMGFMKAPFAYLGGLTHSLHLDDLQFNAQGFISMVLIDSNRFDRQEYTFSFVRNDFLGSVPTMVFDVTPSAHKYGRFGGRVWIERNGGNIVRYNGSFDGTEKGHKEFYHFDSWRTNVQPDLWLPTSFYVEESDEKSPENTVKFKAINHVWGYVLKVPSKDAENVDVEVQGATDVSQDSADVSPLGAQRAWVQQAEDNVVDRLYQAGLLDAPSDFDKILEQIAANILAYNNIQTSRPIRCRTLLTEPLESVAIGNTIILSKGLLDTTAVPGNNNEQVNNLYAVVGFQLAHVLLGHRLDTKYAFNDRLMFPDRTAFSRIPMHHTDKDNEEAVKRTMELLAPKELEGSQAQFGLYLQQLAARSKALKALNEPMLGDGLLKDTKTNTFWLQPLLTKAPKLNMNDLKQNAAMPLSAFLHFDPWTDQVIQLHAAYEPLLSSRDKMPFEVTPVYMRLAYYKDPVPAAAAPAGDAGAAAAQPAAAAPAQPADAQPAAAAPAAGDTTLTPAPAAGGAQPQQ